jgi:hypothetical protein
MPLGAVLFLVGLVLTNAVFLLTRRPLRSGEGMKRWHRVAMWLALAMAMGGLLLGGIGMWLA